MSVGIYYVILLICTLVNLFFYLYLSKLIRFSPEDSLDSDRAISIIVCAKNESQNLRELVPLLLDQTHQNFEIILVNDASTDDTAHVIDEFSLHNTQVHTVNVINNEAFWGNKKYALTLGIKKAVNEHLVFIDADCRPASNEWLSLIAGKFSNKTSIVLGYGGYEKIEGSLLNKLIRFETVFTAFQYMGYALQGHPYMGVGRNLAYTSDTFYKVRGFMDHMNVMGGDDDLFVNQAATGKNTNIIINPNAFTYSKPKQNWNSWWTQKKRHLNVSKYYKLRHKLLLGLFNLSQALFLVTALCGLIMGETWQAIMALIVLRYAVVLFVVGKGCLRFRESELIPFIPLLEIFLLLSQMGILISNKVREPKHWN